MEGWSGVYEALRRDGLLMEVTDAATLRGWFVAMIDHPQRWLVVSQQGLDFVAGYGDAVETAVSRLVEWLE